MNRVGTISTITLFLLIVLFSSVNSLSGNGITDEIILMDIDDLVDTIGYSGGDPDEEGCSVKLCQISYYYHCRYFSYCNPTHKYWDNVVYYSSKVVTEGDMHYCHYRTCCDGPTLGSNEYCNDCMYTRDGYGAPCD